MAVIIVGALLMVGCGGMVKPGASSASTLSIHPSRQAPGARSEPTTTPRASVSQRPGIGARSEPTTTSSTSSIAQICINESKWSQGFTAVQAIGASFVVVVGNGQIISSNDGGAHWSLDYRGGQALSGVDFVDRYHGWAVGCSELLRTTDGVHWTVAGEPPGMAFSEVHFVSTTIGYGQATNPADITEPSMLYRTEDGGLEWTAIHTPVAPYGVSANSLESVWIASGNSLWHSDDGGASWVKVLVAVPASSPVYSDYFGANLQAAGSNDVWAEFAAGSGAGSQDGWVLYNGGIGERFRCIGAYWGVPSASCPDSQVGSAYPPVISALSAVQAAMIPNNPASTSPSDLVIVTLDGNALTVGPVGDIWGPEALSFGTPDTGYMLAVGVISVVNGPQVLEITHDGGRTWTIATRLPSS